MARVIALVPDLLFGSRVQSMLAAAGHDVEMVSSGGAAIAKLGGVDVLVVDLTDEQIGGVALVEDLSSGAARPGERGEGRRPRTLGFYSHVEAQTRARALEAGFDLVVPRSRMAREGGDLVTRLAAG